MKKFSEFIGTVREAEAAKSDLQKSYQDYFKGKLEKFGVDSPADLDDEKKKEFFNEIAADWEAGKGPKEGVKEAEVAAAAEPKKEEEPAEEVNKEGEIDTEKDA